jgi:colicin import membrane protein
MRNCAALVPLLLPLLAAAVGNERAEIAAERERLQVQFAAEERECASRFAVTACLDDLRARRRQALQPLRERELRLDQAERQQRASDRRAAIEAKRSGAAALSPGAASAPQLRVREPLAAPPATPASRPLRGRDDTERAAEAAARAREAEQRKEEAQAAQQRVLQRQAERELAGKKDTPLPVPGALPAASAPKR